MIFCDVAGNSKDHTHNGDDDNNNDDDADVFFGVNDARWIRKLSFSYYVFHLAFYHLEIVIYISFKLYILAIELQILFITSSISLPRIICLKNNLRKMEHLVYVKYRMGV